MNGILVRVAADTSPTGGSWNGPVDSSTGEFVYVAIPEYGPVHPGTEKPYAALSTTLDRLGVGLPLHLREARMHLDPDFEHLTYGDLGQRARQLGRLQHGDLIAFYAGLRDINKAGELVYAIIGLFEVEGFMHAREVPEADRDINAHSRRITGSDGDDLIVRGRPGSSGRLERCLPIGEYRDRAYRVRSDLMEAWGGLSIHDGYLQRSVRLPKLLQPERFREWFQKRGPRLVQANN